MAQIELRVKKLEAQMHTSEEKVKLGEFGYFTRSEIRELVAAITAKGAAFEINESPRGRINLSGTVI